MQERGDGQFWNETALLSPALSSLGGRRGSAPTGCWGSVRMRPWSWWTNAPAFPLAGTVLTRDNLPVSIRLEMLQIARVASKALGDSTSLVREFLLKQHNEDGGFRDRAGSSDLYYTVFGLDGLLALQAELPARKVADYLGGFRGGDGLDFVHLCCLARCWAALGDGARLSLPVDLRTELAARVQEFRSSDGGFSPVRQGTKATAYGCFLAIGAHQDLQAPLPDALEVVRALKWLETPDG